MAHDAFLSPPQGSQTFLPGRHCDKPPGVPHDPHPAARPTAADIAADFRRLIDVAPAFDTAAAQTADQGLDGADGLAALAGWIAGWRGTAKVGRAIVGLYAATYAAAPEGPVQARTRLEFLAQGGGAVNRIGRSLGAGVDVFDLALDKPVRDAAFARALSLREVAATMAFGMEVLAKEPDLLILGDIAPGSTLAAAALIAGLTGGEAETLSAPDDLDWTRQALARARETAPQGPLDWLAELGGRELAALTGAILAARASGVPVLAEGMAAAAAALVAHQIHPDATAALRLAAPHPHPAHAAVAAALGSSPVLGLASVDHEGAAGLEVLALLRLVPPVQTLS
jgi:nicotinate-nucleotide--dimethylbenzimidazole phosphoribosyltransferase